MDRVKTENKKIAQNAHSVESGSVTNVMSVESFIKEGRYTMKKTIITQEHANDLNKKFNIPMETILKEYEIKVPYVPGGKGMSVLEAIKNRDKKLIDLNFDVVDFISNVEKETDDKLSNFSELIEELTIGQKLNLLKNLVAGLNESDEFKRETKELYPALKEGLKVEFNWKDKSKINQIK